MSPGSRAEHLPADEMAAYVDGRLSADRRDEIETHLAACGECLDEVADIRSVLSPSGRPATWRRLAVPLAAAAAIVLLVAVPSMIPDDAATHRDPADVVETPSALVPSGSVDPSPIFRWSRVDEADRYRITVFDASGSVVWSASTRDTAVALPDSIALAPRATYLWQVEGRVGFDRWVTSGLERIEITP